MDATEQNAFRYLVAVLAFTCTMSATRAQSPLAEKTSHRARHGVLDATVAPSTHRPTSGPAKSVSLPSENSSQASKESAASARPTFGETRFPGRAASEGVGEQPGADESFSTAPLVTVTSSLAIVLGLFGGLVWLFRRSGGTASAQLPEEVFSLLGRSSVGPRQNIMLARCGRRILVLAVAPGSTTTLAEITDPDEVADLTAQCGNGGSRQLFHRTLKEMGEEQAGVRGFVEPSNPSPPPRRGLFDNA